MDEIRRAAAAYYKHLPENKKEEAKEIFNAMDKDRDERINRDEYLEYLKKDNNTVPQSLFTQEYLKKDKVLQSLFTELDKDGKGLLDFNEAIFLYYITQSGSAIICQSCDSFLAGAYFSCSQCFFNDQVSTYDLCCDCYGDKKFVHNDIGHIFCDNYTLLRRSRSAIQGAPIKKRTMVLNYLKKGMQAAGITSSDIGGIVTGEDGVDSSKSICSIM
ncbi:hypothetical protein NC653_040964 [Populus alba x Populus x berolinensis]|uniref:EF-hand domain-containing protein n=1 Tax=Populus alba x Populus x berolinensis TaxID=444605 RepID=A0AAD6PNM0_9ROSI|nr:hypothetical protein NC653_040964 [Populus alba x Populus x berolinensis]